ncbi:MAG: formylglycine-generating enzyme family protein [Roseococcus sp.]|nr:formylglycine-generating enzyme family protein [Roseococcus sp.]
MSGPLGRFRDLPEGPEMILLPAGDFAMGSAPGEPGRCPDPQEGPRRAMRILRPFAIAAEPVTRGLFARFAADSGLLHRGVVRRHADGGGRPDPDRGFEDPGFPQAEDHPAVGLSWHDAVAIADWMARRTGRPYRLPSEAEWEYAARAGTRTAFWWGETIGPGQANADFREGYAGRPPAGVFRGGTCPVRQFAPNPWGLWQSSGNVWEWCADGFSEALDRLPGDGAAAPARGTALRVLRGGSFLNGPWNLRNACRLGDPAGFRHVSFGVRLACDVEVGPRTGFGDR